MAAEDNPPLPPPPTDKIIPFSIPNKVPIKLDLEKHNYNSWSSFSLIHLGSLGLKSHVKTDTASTNPEWCQLDLTKMWILISSRYHTGQRKSLMGPPQKYFHDNKDAKAINLENELRFIKIGRMMVNEYCTKIQAMTNRLKNLDCEVSEKNMVIFAVNGLDSRFATLAEIIHHREPLPTFETVRNMLLLKESSFNDDFTSTTFESSSSSPTILMASSSSNIKGTLAQPVQHTQPHPTVTAHQPAVYMAHQQVLPGQAMSQSNSNGILGAAPVLYASQPTSLPSAFSTMSLGKIDQTLFIKRQKEDIILVQVYVDDIIFRSTKKELCTEFEVLMHDKFQMSSMGELTFFLGLQVKQKYEDVKPAMIN
nr:hybrid signal transduction histidine kinase M [Tanacetum cinerariifolium]